MARRKTRTAAQKRATSRLVALNRARKGGPRKRHTSHAYAANPASRPHRHVKRRSAHPARRHSYRRNPVPRMGGIMSMIKPAYQGALGALGIDLITGYVPLPLAIKVSPVRHAIKGILAVGLGMFFKGSMGRNMAIGGLTVAIHDASKEAVQMALPTVQLGAEPSVSDLRGLAYYNPAVEQHTAMGEYESAPGMSTLEDQGMYAY